MKIVSTNKSDVFDQYLSIMKRYNEKRIIKNAGLPISSYSKDLIEIKDIVSAMKHLNIVPGKLKINDPGEFKRILDKASEYRDISPNESIKKAYKELFNIDIDDAVLNEYKKVVMAINDYKDYLSGEVPNLKMPNSASPPAPAPTASPAAAAARAAPSAAPTAPAAPAASATAAPAAPAASASATAAPAAAVEKISNFATKDELNKAIKDSSNEITSKLEDLTKKIESLKVSTPDEVSKTIEKLEDSIRQTEALKTKLESLTTKTEKDLEAIEKLSKSIKDQSQSKSFLQRASEFFGQNKEVQKKSFIVAAAKYMTIAAATTAGIYYTYSYLSEDEEPVRGTSEDRVRIPTGESASQRGAAGDDSSLDNNKTALGNILSDPSRRMEYFESLKQMDEERSEDILNKIARYYGASGYIMLQNPVTIKGEFIEYVFPRAFRGGRDPIKDPARRAVTEDYFTKVYTQDTRNNRRIITRFESSAGSSDAQRIANYAFSTISASGLFSGEGALFGDRGERYGKGKRNVGRSDLGIAGTSRRKMTREERRAVNRGLQQSEAIDYMSDEDLDFADPMEAFSSAYSEENIKYSYDLNLSTNNLKSYEFAKKADKISNRYFKDAVKDLDSDEFMKAYYSGYSKLHNQKAKKPKQDYNKLYDLHDETGEELIHKSHPKAISVAEAIGSGGLVENLNERSKSMQDIAKRTPSGNYRARYASKKN
jgi:hypothetical protein